MPQKGLDLASLLTLSADCPTPEDFGLRQFKTDVLEVFVFKPHLLHQSGLCSLSEVFIPVDWDMNNSFPIGAYIFVVATPCSAKFPPPFAGYASEMFTTYSFQLASAVVEAI